MQDAESGRQVRLRDVSRRVVAVSEVDVPLHDFPSAASATVNVHPVGGLVVVLVKRIVRLFAKGVDLQQGPTAVCWSVALSILQFSPFLCLSLFTILAIKIRTALKCHNLLNFNRSEMIFLSKFASSKDLSNETKLVPVSLSV